MKVFYKVKKHNYSEGIHIIKKDYSIFVFYYMPKYNIICYIEDWWDEYNNEKYINYDDKHFQRKVEKHIAKLLKWAERKENQMDNVNNIIDNAEKYVTARANARELLLSTKF